MFSVPAKHRKPLWSEGRQLRNRHDTHCRKSTANLAKGLAKGLCSARVTKVPNMFLGHQLGNCKGDPFAGLLWENTAMPSGQLHGRVVRATFWAGARVRFTGALFFFVAHQIW